MASEAAIHQINKQNSHWILLIRMSEEGKRKIRSFFYFFDIAVKYLLFFFPIYQHSIAVPIVIDFYEFNIVG